MMIYGKIISRYQEQYLSSWTIAALLMMEVVFNLNLIPFQIHQVKILREKMPKILNYIIRFLIKII
jgi:hypothetical protein